MRNSKHKGLEARMGDERVEAMEADTVKREEWQENETTNHLHHL